MKGDAIAATRGVQLVLGYAVWSVWFVAAYGGLSLGCLYAAPPVEDGARTWLNAALALLSAAAFAVLLVLAWRCWRALRAAGDLSPTQRLVAGVSAALHGSAAAALVFVGTPIVALPPCS